MQAEIYQREGDDETTYFLLFRHAHLVLTNLTAHPSVRDESLRSAWKEANDAVQKELLALDQLKPRINERYKRYQKIMQEREARARAQSRRMSEDVVLSNDERQFERQRTRHVNAHEHTDLAAKLAQREHTRRAARPQAASPPGVDDLQSRIRAITTRIEGQDYAPGGPHTQHMERRDAGYQYPSIHSNRAQAQAQQYNYVDRQADVFDYQQQSSTLPPAPPPKHGMYTQPPTAPARPEKVLDGSFKPPSRPGTPGDDRMFASAATLENGTALRTIFLPSTLRTTFLRLAYKNTLNNLETCGFLAGTLMKNAFFVSKLVVPSQTATSDTCEMTNESELFDFVDQADLMILGWIHTHPSQTCFMSSRDLHTHSGYQVMLAESVAVVCAPSKGDTSHGGDYGVFRLTDPPGKKVILNCDKPGIFHPHEVDNIYTDALRPGHVVEVKDMPFDVVDLR